MIATATPRGELPTLVSRNHDLWGNARNAVLPSAVLGERIDEASAEGLKIIHIASNHRQSANQSGGSDERIFKMVIRASMHELRPAAEDGGVRRKNAVALLYAVEPVLDFFGLLSILLAGNFYPSLYFADCHRGHVQ
jgi:hypothetical protein